jgi:hypothetical protein
MPLDKRSAQLEVGTNQLDQVRFALLRAIIVLSQSTDAVASELAGLDEQSYEAVLTQASTPRYAHTAAK